MTILLVAIALVLALLTHGYTVASGSMLPSLTVKDRVMVLKWYPTPRRGDIVAFSFPGDRSTTYIHRLIGMPGDRIQMLEGNLHINGQPVKRMAVEDYIYDSKPVKQWSETLPNGVTHRTLDIVEHGFYDNTPVYTVPSRHYFMMGDNRDNASDSRLKGRTVPHDHLIGHVVYCWNSPCR